MKYFLKVGNSLSQLLNTILNGNEDITTSARAHHLKDKWPWIWLYRFLNFIDPGHTLRAWENDKDEFDGKQK